MADTWIAQGESNLKKGETDKALNPFQRGLNILEAKTLESIRTASARLGLAQVHIGCGDVSSQGLKNAQVAVDICEKLPEQVVPGLAAGPYVFSKDQSLSSSRGRGSQCLKTPDLSPKASFRYYAAKLFLVVK